MGKVLSAGAGARDAASGLLLSAVIALVASFMAPLGQQALANGDGVEIYWGREGAYEVIVSVQPDRPTVGTIHFTVTPLNAETLVPVVDADIEIVAHDPLNNPRFRVLALNPPLDLNYYDANVTVDSPGTWTLMVSVTSELLGEATFIVPVDVVERPLAQTTAGTIVWLAVLSTLVAGSGYVWHRSRRSRSLG